MRCKIAIVGAGRVGSQVAAAVAARGGASLVLVDLEEGRAGGLARDLNESAVLSGNEPRHVGSFSWQEAAGSEVVVLCCADADDRLEANAEIVQDVVSRVARSAPDAVVVVVTSPVDVICHVALRASGFPRARVVGMGGIVDSARFRLVLSRELGLSAHDVDCLVLGAHGQAMVPLLSSARAHGLPLGLSPEAAQGVVARTREASWGRYACAAGVVAMVEAIVDDSKRVLPCSAFCQGEYGLRDDFVGVPVRLGREGVEEIVELVLDDGERAALERSAAVVREQVERLSRSPPAGA
jgi:malate dehydrogenase